MSATLKRAIEEKGIVEFSRWMLPDGQFLGVDDWQDHRNVGQFCTDSWLDFIKKDCVSIHYDGSCGYLWIRVNQELNTSQRMVFSRLLDDKYIKVKELYVQIYEGDKYDCEADIIINDAYMCKLFLTDTIAYKMEVNQELEY